MSYQTQQVAFPGLARTAAIAVVGLMLSVVFNSGPLQGQGLTYVDANDGFVGTQNLFPTTALNQIEAIEDDLWGFRDSFGAEGPGGRFIFESGGTTSGVEDSPEIFQTISGLTPSSMYDVYAVYWSAEGQNWNIRTGTSSGDLTLYDLNGSIEGATAGIPAASAVWNSPPEDDFGEVIFTEDDRLMLLGLAGTVTADGSGEATVYFDDLPNTDFADRSWLDGVAYLPAGSNIALSATIDRNSGQLTLSNNTASDFSFSEIAITSGSSALDASSWLSITENYDEGGSLDTDSWEIVEPADTPMFTGTLSEMESAGGTNGATLSTGSAVNFGNVWNDTPFEDVQIALTDEEGNVTQLTPDYTGQAHLLGDFNNSGSVGLDDYQVFTSNLHTNVSTLGQAEAYLRGDMNGDLMINHDDFVAFRDAFPGSLAAALAEVPEPTALMMTLLAGGACLMLLPRTRRGLAFCGARETAFHSQQSRSRSRKLHFHRFLVFVMAITACAIATPTFAQLTYVDADFNTNTGPSSAFAGAVTEPDGLWGEREFATEGTILESSGVGSGSEDSPEIFTTLDGLSANQSYLVYAHFWDAFTWNIQAGFTSGDLTLFAAPEDAEELGATPATLASDLTYVSDPLFTEDDRTMFAASVGPAQASAAGEITVFIDDLPGGGETNTRTWYDGLSYMEYHPLTLQVNTTTGSAAIVNNNTMSIDFNYYEVRSDIGSLDPTWNGIDGDTPTTETTWERAGGSDSLLIAETNLLGMESMEPTDSLSIGQAFDGTTAADQDLSFYFAMPDGTLLQGLVDYVSGGLEGDFNGDSVVDGSDFLLWQRNPAVGNLADWQANYGTGALASGINAVPEPAAISLLVAVASLITCIRRRSSGC